MFGKAEFFGSRLKNFSVGVASFLLNCLLLSFFFSFLVPEHLRAGTGLIP